MVASHRKLWEALRPTEVVEEQITTKTIKDQRLEEQASKAKQRATKVENLMKELKGCIGELSTQRTKLKG